MSNVNVAGLNGESIRPARTGGDMSAFAFSGAGRQGWVVNDALSLECPHCGEPFTIGFDVSEGSAEFVVDCEVCCRPIAVAVRLGDDGEIESLDVAES